MLKMTKNSAMGGLLEPIKNSAIWKSVLREAVLREAQCTTFILSLKCKYPALNPNFILQLPFKASISLSVAMFCTYFKEMNMGLSKILFSNTSQQIISKLKFVKLRQTFPLSSEWLKPNEMSALLQKHPLYAVLDSPCY